MTLINFKNFYFRYKGNKDYALKNINLEINENQFILLAGGTGSGKTSLIRCINGLIPQFYAGFYKGKVEIDGMDTTKVPISELSTIVGIVFQNPENQLVSMNIEHEIAFGMENLGFSRDTIKKKINEVIQLTGIEDLLDKAPFEISGGEQQRVALASILVLEPKILILDEPTANLDPFFAKKIIRLIKQIQEEKDITVIISEHRMDLIVPVVDSIILMDEGKMLEYDTKKNVINGKNFERLSVNKPILYSLFNSLKKNKKFDGEIPTSLQEFQEFLRKIKN